MISRTLGSLGALIIALIVGGITALCAVLIFGGGASVLVSGDGMLWPNFLDGVITAIAIVVFISTTVISFRELKAKFTR